MKSKQKLKDLFTKTKI